MLITPVSAKVNFHNFPLLKKAEILLPSFNEPYWECCEIHCQRPCPCQLFCRAAEYGLLGHSGITQVWCIVSRFVATPAHDLYHDLIAILGSACRLLTSTYFLYPFSKQMYVWLPTAKILMIWIDYLAEFLNSSLWRNWLGPLNLQAIGQAHGRFDRS